MKTDKMKPLLVGEDNPYQADPARAQRYALYPLPQNSAGGRLCALILQMTVKEYISTFDRVNLCSGKWSTKKARECAAELLHDRGPGSQADFGRGQHDVIVLLGKKVCDAFKIKFVPFTTQVVPTGPAREVSVAILPHPSGRNLAWNHPRAFERARETLRAAGALPGGLGGLWDRPADGPSPFAELAVPSVEKLDAIAKHVVGKDRL